MSFSKTFSNNSSGQVASIVPDSANALFWLNGDVVFTSGNYYFVDRSVNGRNFLITGYDFEAGTKGFPYKSLATISAPIADAILISADVNSFLYTAGVPNQIPVVSLFQDIDYEHKLFCRHANQLLDGTLKEIYEPRALDITLYNTVLSGTLLTDCQIYFNVPTENVSTAVWISPTGNDTTGTGTKANPWRSIDKIKATTAPVVYMRTGAFDITANVTFSSVSLINIIATGRVRCNTGTRQITFNSAVNINGLDLITDTVLTTFQVTQNFATTTWTRCRITKTGTGTSWAYIGTGQELNLVNCVIFTNVTYGIYALQGGISKVSIIGCAGSLGAADDRQLITTFEVKYCKLNQYITRNSKTVNATIFNNFSKTNIKVATATTENIKYNTIIDGTLSAVSCNNAVVENNYVHASYTNKLTENLAFALTTGTGGVATGISVKNNTFIGSAATQYITTLSYSDGCEFHNNKVVNEYVGTGTGHTVFLLDGINYSVKYNDIIMSNGHGIVVKSGGIHYTTTTPHIAYNVFKCTGYSVNVIWVRGAWGVIFANNTAVHYSGSRIYALDDNNVGHDNSLECINNVISVSALTPYDNGGAIVYRNNLLNTNGLGSAILPPNDGVTTVTIDLNGVPASRLDNGETLTGTGSDIGLDAAYIIPSNLVNKTQNELWQKGAVIL